MAIELAGNNAGNDIGPVGRVGRPAIHASSAARQRAHRARLARLDVAIKPEIAETISEIAEQLNCSRNEVVNSLIRFALTNRNWKQVGLMGARR